MRTKEGGGGDEYMCEVGQVTEPPGHAPSLCLDVTSGIEAEEGKNKSRVKSEDEEAFFYK